MKQDLLQEQTKLIVSAWGQLRYINSDIPSELLDLMKDLPIAYLKGEIPHPNSNYRLNLLIELQNKAEASLKEWELKRLEPIADNAAELEIMQGEHFYMNVIKFLKTERDNETVS